MNDVSMFKGLLRNQLLLFYPEVMLDSDDVRAAMEGQNGLLDDAVLRRLQENNIAISRIYDTGLERLQQLQSAWKRQPEAVVRSGSAAVSLAHAIVRLNAVYHKYFAAIPAVAQPGEVTLASPADGGAGSIPSDK
jgi:hypothetical protein